MTAMLAEWKEMSYIFPAAAGATMLTLEHIQICPLTHPLVLERVSTTSGCCTCTAARHELHASSSHATERVQDHLNAPKVC
jgi:hypothetical protein